MKVQKMRAQIESLKYARYFTLYNLDIAEKGSTIVEHWLA